MTVLYPELQRGPALEVLGDVRRAWKKGVHEVERLRAISHPRAFAAPTGGSAATDRDLRDLRDAVDADIDQLAQSGGRGDSVQREFDLVLGRSLHRHWRGSPAGASREGVWNFLTLVMFPQLLCRRFGDLPEPRALGTPRNVLRRVWMREHVLGDVIHNQQNPLREDEFVQIMERTALARTPSLARIIAVEVLNRPAGPYREEFTRELAKDVVRSSGPVLLDSLDQAELTALVSTAASRVSESLRARPVSPAGSGTQPTRRPTG